MIDCSLAVAGCAVAKGLIADPACATGSHAENALRPALGFAPMWAAADLSMGPLAGSATSPAVALVLACLAVHASWGCHAIGPAPMAVGAGTAQEAAAAAARMLGSAPHLAAAAAAMLLRVCLKPGLEPDQRSATVLAQG